MSVKKQKHYSKECKTEILRRIGNGEVSLKEFFRTSGISRYTVQSWRRIQQGKVIPKIRKRSRLCTKPLKN